ELLITSIARLGMRVKLTTNGFFLFQKEKMLKEAGVSSINVSLDAANEASFLRLTRVNNFYKVVKGIDKALSNGMEVKLNSVILKGKNEDQILPLLEF